MKTLILSFETTPVSLKTARYTSRYGPLRKTITASTFLGGDSPAFSDYAVAGIFYWARTLSCFEILESGDPVFSWLEEVLNLYSSQFKRPEDAPMA